MWRESRDVGTYVEKMHKMKGEISKKCLEGVWEKMKIERRTKHN